MRRKLLVLAAVITTSTAQAFPPSGNQFPMGIVTGTTGVDGPFAKVGASQGGVTFGTNHALTVLNGTTCDALFAQVVSTTIFCMDSVGDLALPTGGVLGQYVATGSWVGGSPGSGSVSSDFIELGSGANPYNAENPEILFRGQEVSGSSNDFTAYTVSGDGCSNPSPAPMVSLVFNSTAQSGSQALEIADELPDGVARVTSLLTCSVFYVNQGGSYGGIHMGIPSSTFPATTIPVILAQTGDPTSQTCVQSSVLLRLDGTSSSNTLYECIGTSWVALTNNQGTVTSVGLSMPAEFSVASSPVTSSGTLAVTKASQSQNLVYASPNGSSGMPTFRALVAADIPSLSYAGTGANSFTGLNTFAVGAQFGGSGVTTYPWHPSSDPSCSVSLGGTSCSTTITVPNNSMRCTANDEAVALGGVGYAIAVSAPSSSVVTITYGAVGTVAGGGTVTFSVVCV